MDRRLTQGQTAQEIGVNKKTYEYWKQGRTTEVAARYLPGVIRFLGYDPSPAPVSLPERIRAARRRQGISQRELARQLGLDPSTVEAWETDKVRRPFPRYLRLFEKYVRSML